MKIPGLDDAVISRAKITDYLLSTTHPAGRHEAAFFLGHGFAAESWKVLRDSLLDLARRHEVSEATTTAYGKKLVIDGDLSAPMDEAPGPARSGSSKLARISPDSSRPTPCGGET